MVQNKKAPLGGAFFTKDQALQVDYQPLIFVGDGHFFTTFAQLLISDVVELPLKT